MLTTPAKSAQHQRKETQQIPRWTAFRSFLVTINAVKSQIKRMSSLEMLNTAIVIPIASSIKTAVQTSHTIVILAQWKKWTQLALAIPVRTYPLIKKKVCSWFPRVQKTGKTKVIHILNVRRPPRIRIGLLHLKTSKRTFQCIISSVEITIEMFTAVFVTDYQGLLFSGS